MLIASTATVFLLAGSLLWPKSADDQLILHYFFSRADTSSGVKSEAPVKNLFHNKIMQMEQPALQIIGVLHGDIKSRGDAPKNFDESERVGTLEIYPEYQEGLEGIVAGQTIVVLFWLHQSGRDVLKVYPRGDTSRGLRGVFSTRSPMRPNPIAISELKVLAIHGNLIEVSGLDILDGTPIVDIKKLISR